MQNDYSRRRFLERSALLGTSVGLFPTMLAGCGGGSDDTQSSLAKRRDFALATPVAPVALPTPAVTKLEWKPLKVGAGGYVTGIDIAPDGTKVVRADSAGAFIWDDAKAEWKPLLTWKSMPVGEAGHEITSITGVYEVAVAPSNTSVIYMIFNGFVFKSINRGSTFIKTALAQIVAVPNDDFRTLGRKMAIDPVNPNIVYVGSQTAGLFVTQDGGSTWAKHADIPVSTTAAGVIIAFDPSSGTVGSKTKGIYVSSNGHGLFASSDAGSSFAAIPGSPIAHKHLVCDQTGVVWVTDGAAPLNNARRYARGVWTAMATASDQNWNSIAVNPANAKHVVLGGISGALAQSRDGGSIWESSMAYGWPVGAGDRVANDIPWLAWTNENYMSAGDMKFDPSSNNKLYFAEGIGVWWTNPPPTWTSYKWVSQSIGIEQLVSNVIIAPPGGKPLYFSWDRPVFKLDDLKRYPSEHGPDRDHAIVCGWSGGCAIDDSKFIVGLMNYWGIEKSGFSTDGGANWIKFSSIPSDVSLGKIAGSIAVSNKDNIVWIPSNNASPFYTLDRGLTWTRIKLPNVPTNGETGWGFAYFLNRQIVAADKVTSGTFYMYNYLPTCVGLYRSTNGGVDWIRVYAKEIAPASISNALLVTVPGKSGHLFFTSGEQSGPNPGLTSLMRSVDGGISWTSIADVFEVYCIGFGKAATGSDYPAIYIAGYVKGEWGIWQSDNNAVTWTKIGDRPLDNLDVVKTISGDMDVYGRVYLGFGGSGGAYAELITA